MIRRIEVLSCKCLRYISQDLAPFQILVGPNASGKSSFLDTLVFLPDLLNNGLERAVRKRARTLKELTWKMGSDVFEIAIEIDLPRNSSTNGSLAEYSHMRYEIQVGLNDDSGLTLSVENLWFCREEARREKQGQLQPELFSWRDRTAP